MKNLIFFLALIFCNNNCSTMNERNIFENINSNNFMTYLILEEKGSSMSGLLIGAELNIDNSPVYYIAELKDLVKNKIGISFGLRNIQFSEKEIDYKIHAISELNSNTKIPLLLQYNLYFNATVLKDKIELKRFSDLYDSNFDEIVFNKIEN